MRRAAATRCRISSDGIFADSLSAELVTPTGSPSGQRLQRLVSGRDFGLEHRLSTRARESGAAGTGASTSASVSASSCSSCWCWSAQSALFNFDPARGAVRFRAVRRTTSPRSSPPISAPRSTQDPRAESSSVHHARVRRHPAAGRRDERRTRGVEPVGSRWPSTSAARSMRCSPARAFGRDGEPRLETAVVMAPIQVDGRAARHGGPAAAAAGRPGGPRPRTHPVACRARLLLIVATIVAAVSSSRRLAAG